jgi:hypothetical protein
VEMQERKKRLAETPSAASRSGGYRSGHSRSKLLHVGSTDATNKQPDSDGTPYATATSLISGAPMTSTQSASYSLAGRA